MHYADSKNVYKNMTGSESRWKLDQRNKFAVKALKFTVTHKVTNDYPDHAWNDEMPQLNRPHQLPKQSLHYHLYRYSTFQPYS